ncbi:hypothetical protein DL771_012449 [Monosporascus sp. 5C6A]|nr:hypothetical protein DL771_012449 [Monosporascus sp. 5C6A]
MDSPASRGRRGSAARKRHSFPARSSSQNLPESVDLHPSSTPAAEMHSSSFTFETPSPSNLRGTRKRGRQVEGADSSPEDAETKGGRSLRKRTRVDYSFDQLDYDENYGPKSTPTTSRPSLRKRKASSAFHDDELDEEAETRARRRASEQPPQSAPRRRGPGKKSNVGIPPSYMPDPQIDDVEVKDTIEVGGHHSSHSDESSQRRASSSSSQTDSNPPQQNGSEDTVVVQETPKVPHPPGREPARNSLKHKIPAPEQKAPEMKTPQKDQSAAVDHSLEDADPLEHLTPYIDGAVTLYPAIRSEAEPDPETDMAQEDAAQPEEAIDDAADGVEEETPAGTPRPTETRANSPAPDSDVIDIIPPVRKQYPYKQTRPASEFTDLFTDIKSLSQGELQRRLEVVNHALVAWQNEYNELRKITDDEDNAQRYNQEEAAFLHRQKMAISKDPDANPVQKEFVVRGIRAQKPDPYIAYAKQQDRIMANAYLFEYDDRESKIGQQDPIAQRAGIGKGRLRDRPKQTAKAAEADDANVVHGKRPRKAPVLFDGGDATSRASTPVPVPGRPRRRAGQATEENGDAPPASQSSQPPAPPGSQPQHAEQEKEKEKEPPKKRGKGGRPRKHPLPAPVPEEDPAPAADVDAEPQPQPAAAAPKEKRTRKRRRRAQNAEDEPAENGTTQEALPKPAAPRRRNHGITEISSGSFYTTSIASTAALEESRPRTSSSTATVSTVTSNYQLREKRRTNFSSFSDGGEQQPVVQEEKEPRPKRVRRAPKKIQTEDFAPFHESMPTLAPTLAPAPAQPAVAAPAVRLPGPPHVPLVPKPPPRIKIKNYHHPAPASGPTLVLSSEASSLPPSSTDATPPLSTNGNGNSADGADAAGDPPKDYNTMTKSEKMSYSMKARWASGSMNPAVVKRRATLAAKKQATTKPLAPGQQQQGPDAPAIAQ